MAHCNLGGVLQSQGKIAEAMAHYQRSLAMMPHYAQLHNNIGVGLARCGRIDEAIGLYRKALEIKPDYGEATTTLVPPCLTGVGRTRRWPIFGRPWN